MNAFLIAFGNLIIEMFLWVVSRPRNFVITLAIVFIVAAGLSESLRNQVWALALYLFYTALVLYGAFWLLKQIISGGRRHH